MRAAETAAQTARAADELPEGAKPPDHKFVRVGALEEELPGDAEAALVPGKNDGDGEWRVRRRQSRQCHSRVFGRSF